MSVRPPRVESCAMPARSPFKAAIRLWRWTTSSGHLNAVCATPWGWPHLQCLEDVGPTIGWKGASPTTLEEALRPLADYQYYQVIKYSSRLVRDLKGVL